jgi:elongation factor Ts
VKSIRIIVEAIIARSRPASPSATPAAPSAARPTSRPPARGRQRARRPEAIAPGEVDLSKVELPARCRCRRRRRRELDGGREAQIAAPPQGPGQGRVIPRPTGFIYMSTPITAQMVNELREKTGAGLLDCKKALTEANGNGGGRHDPAQEGVASAAKKADRTTKEGVIESYIHFGGKVGVLIEVNCETDFVARNDEFKAFVKDLCLQIAAASPLYVTRDQVPEAELAQEREIAAPRSQGKPPAAVQKIVEGKLEKYYSTVCLLDQPFVKLPDKT